MQLKGFGLSIVKLPSNKPAQEDEKGYVPLVHGQQYGIELHNQSFLRRAQAEVFVQGKSVGTWIMPPGGRGTIEHPQNDDACFHFYGADTNEARQAGGETGDTVNGLVQVKYTYEQRPQPKPVSDLYAKNDIDPGYSRPIALDYGTLGASSESTTYSVNTTSSAAEVYSVPKRPYGEGVSGLAGHSDQTWKQHVGPFLLDEASDVTVSVRLVLDTRSTEPHPIQSVRVNANPVPPPVK